ncbi:MAG TPA: hypothetical protein VNH19_21715 [Candidatus Limnocylindrales bacterium]|nr:hypothetical protein [Candidatus Limnocylindrales bacterium]
MSGIPKRVIFLDVPADDMILAVRAARWLGERFTKDAILAYGEDNGDSLKHFYVRRNKASITVRPC